MRAGSLRRRSLAALIGLLAAAIAAPAAAIDNPDAPDYVAEFEARAKPLEDAVSAAPDGAATAAAQRAYAAFLEGELNSAYQRLLPKLEPAARAGLQTSQRQWLAFRKAELAFIARNWVPQNFGSSYALSRADYAASLVKQRVVALLRYLKNYPA